MKYQKGFKYQLTEDYRVLTSITGYDIDITWIKLEPDGYLTLKLGFAWDGSSGPTWDTKTCKRSSAEHDAFCRLMVYKLIPRKLKNKIDKIYYNKCIKDGMWKIKAWWRYKALEKTGEIYVKPKNRKKIYEVPK